MTDCEVKIEAERSEDIPSVFTHINLIYMVAGTNLSEEQVNRAVSLSMEKYCSVTKMLEGSVDIGYEVEIQQAP